ncbi:thiamine-phosphate kinase [Desulfobulbus alkaliphilus]|uniref:thiamine-phosphate kinase n=1 Tax=Desulfobulbus alkaliphilus TaxID=869814 RepID=UPI001962C961|nr:thiamine-phosphate kinase [Desulfobulbus alkaliphilus]
MNERQIIEYIVDLAGPESSADLVAGIGDDCAVVARDDRRSWLLTMDTLIESIHFDTSFHPPEKVGRKAVSVNVSDIAAMGGAPLFVLLSAAMPRGFDQEWFKAFGNGLAAACREYGCLIIGGDTVRNPDGFAFTLTVIGQIETSRVVYRHGARPGDTIWVSGELGLAAAGLHMLSSGIGADEQDFAAIREKHLNPTARVALGQALAAAGLVHAMMDLSDGLATDLAHICRQSGVAGRIIGHDLPGAATLARPARLVGADTLNWIISGGEDYELLFTADPANSAAIRRIAEKCELKVSPVGDIIEGTGVTLVRRLADGTCSEEVVAYRGYDHFRSSDGGQGGE